MQKPRIIGLLCALLLGLQVFAQDGYILHTVLKGQGLYSIARIYGVTEDEIIALNPGSDIVIRAGEQLKIPRKEGQKVTETQPDSNSANQQQTLGHVQQTDVPETVDPDDGFIHHTVQAGETIYRLTVKYGITGEEIYKANPILRTEPLKTGQVVLIPSKSAAQTTADIQENTAAQLDEEDDETDEKKNGYRMKGAYGSKAKKSDKTDDDNFWRRLFGKKKKADVQPFDSTKCEYQHIVRKGETVFSISRTYGLTEAELLAANPTVAGTNIKRDQVLCIPYKSASEPTTADTQRDVADSDDTDLLTPDKTDDGVIHAALILPFMLDENTSTPTADQSKMVEFYEGFLLAIDSLRDDGISFDLHVYDSGEATRSLRPILEKEEMATMDIIFGPMHTQHINEAADFARTHAIPLVLPFARNVAQLAGNPYLWQVNADPSTIEQEGVNHFFELFPKPNVLFFQTKGVTDSFCTHLQRELDSRGIAYNTFPADTTSNVRPFMEACSRDSEADNILMMTSSDNASLSTMIPVFQLIMRDTASVADIHLYGYPQYQTYAPSHGNEFFELDTWYHTAFYTNNTLSDATALNNKFSRTYSREIAARYPRYGLLGFDIGYWFLKGLAGRGPAPAETVFSGMTTYHCPTIQTGFNFSRVSPTGGYANASVYVVHMRADGKIFKVDFAW